MFNFDILICFAKEWYFCDPFITQILTMIYDLLLLINNIKDTNAMSIVLVSCSYSLQLQV